MNRGRMSLHSLIYHDRRKAFDGYTLFNPIFGGKDVWLVDMEGRFVHQWRLPYSPKHGRILPNGNLLCGCRIPGGPLDDFGGSMAKLLEIDLNGNIVWQYNDRYLSHDFSRMNNGNTMILRWVATPDEIAKRVEGGLQGTERDGIMWGDSLQEITPDGKVVWEWIGYEHMDPKVDILCPLCGRERWANANSVFVMDNGDVLLSVRFINTILIIDKKTGKIKWRWGPGEIAHSHDAQVLQNGNILLFDNGMHRNSRGDRADTLTHSRVIELDPQTKEIVWEYKDEVLTNFHSPVCSGCQRLPNGNTLICEAVTGRIFEITSDGETVWEYVVPFYRKHPAYGLTNLTFRANRYGPDYEGFKGKDFTFRVTDVELESKEEIIKDRTQALGY